MELLPFPHRLLHAAFDFADDLRLGETVTGIKGCKQFGFEEHIVVAYYNHNVWLRSVSERRPESKLGSFQFAVGHADLDIFQEPPQE